MIKVEDHREFYNLYFKEFNRLAVGSFADLSYGNDKPNDTAGSLESVIAYAAHIQFHYGNEDRILNAGAGASSWMLRKLFKDVCCHDPHNQYLTFVAHVCHLNGFKNLVFREGLFFGDYADGGMFDHCYYDYGSIERIPYLGSAIDQTTHSLYIDDMQDTTYYELVKKLCAVKGLSIIECPESIDEYGRFGIIIEKPL